MKKTPLLLERVNNNIALIDADCEQTLTYAEVSKAIEPIVTRLGENKSLIFLFCENNVEAVLIYLAALEGNHAICLLDAHIKNELKQHLVKLYSPHHIFDPKIDVNFSEHYEQLECPHLKTGVWQLRNPSKAPKLHPDLQLLLSTSGTTGSPKLIRLTGGNIVSNGKSIAEYLDITHEERAIASLPFHYSYGLSVINSHLLAGASIVLTRKSVLQPDFWKLFDQYQCTSFAGVPYTYQILHRIGFEKFSVPTLRTMTQAGGKLDKKLVMKFHELMKSQGKRFVVMYGQTEATARIAWLPPEFLPEKAGSIGKTIPGGKLKLLDGRKEITTPKKIGEVTYEGPNVMLGYASHPEDLAKEDENHGALRTGDLAYQDEDGFFFITGRMKRISKVYGLRINLDEIEEQLRTHGPVAVTSNDTKISIFFEAGAQNQYDKCIQQIAKDYQLHHTTFSIHQIEKLPLTPSGKVDYNRLEENTYATR